MKTDCNIIPPIHYLLSRLHVYMATSLPNPASLLPADIVTKNKLLIANHTSEIFSSDSTGGCGRIADVIVYCTGDTCIFWEHDPINVPDHKKVFKFLLRLEEYIRLGMTVMDYDPRTLPPIRQYTGLDGITRKMVIELNNELCAGYGGASHNGQPWVATPKFGFWFSYDTINKIKPLMHQVFFYELGRSLYDITLDDILDWQMQNPSEWGYWTLGFNGAMTVLAPERMGVELEYFGQNTLRFRQDRLRDLATYIGSTKYTFNNTWCSYLLPWNSNQSINDVMSGLLIYLSDTYGGLPFLTRLFINLKKQPPTPHKTDRQLRATNLYKATHQSALDLYDTTVAGQIRTYFRTKLRWTFV